MDRYGTCPFTADRVRRERRADDDRLTVAVHVNFGVYTGREATLAEIDRLAASLLDRVPHVTIVSEVRHEIDRHSEAAVHQVRIEVPPREAEAPPEQLESWLVDQAERWARQCLAERSTAAV